MEINSLNEKIQFIKNCYKLKPVDIFISELKWKAIIFSIINNENLLITGESGTGKTTIALALKSIFKEKKFFNIPMGSTQDARISILGSTHYNKEKGTFFSKSEFIQAIETPNSIILLEELTRADGSAGNLLMPLLDENQKFLKIEEDVNCPTIKLADNVCFIATANIGRKYTATNILDFAFENRFNVIEMDVLNYDDEYQFQSNLFPTINFNIIEKICQIAIDTRNEMLSYERNISTPISTKAVKRFLTKYKFGFNFNECVELEIYPIYKNIEELQFIKQLIGKYI